MRRVVRFDPHEVLGVPVGAGPAEVRAAWRRAARESHPDRGGDVEVFRRARAAFDLLGHQRDLMAGQGRPLLVRQLTPQEVAKRWWRRRRDRARRPRVA